MKDKLKEIYDKANETINSFNLDTGNKLELLKTIMKLKPIAVVKE